MKACGEFLVSRVLKIFRNVGGHGDKSAYQGATCGLVWYGDGYVPLSVKPAEHGRLLCPFHLAHTATRLIGLQGARSVFEFDSIGLKALFVPLFAKPKCEVSPRDLVPHFLPSSNIFTEPTLWLRLCSLSWNITTHSHHERHKFYLIQGK